jgi:hypothetical protein
MNLLSQSARILCIATLGTFMSVAAPCQTASPHQPGTIMEVKAHQSASESANATKQYDVSIKAGNTIYVVLFTPPKGSNLVEYKTGTEILVSIQGDSLKFTDMTGRSETVPILSQKRVDDEKPK